jgi:hypothetical protein
MIALALVPLLASACAKNTDLSPVGTGTQRMTVVTATGTQSVGLRQDDNVNMQDFDRPADLVWKALPAVYESMGISVTTMDQARKLIGADGVRLRRSLKGVPLSRYFDCGQTQIGPNADDYEVFLTMLTRVVPAGASNSKVEVTTTVLARPVARRQNPQACTSLNTLDAKFIETLRVETSRR